MTLWTRKRTSQRRRYPIRRQVFQVERLLRFEVLEPRRLMAPVPIYHSLPGAPAALYLDFDGHFEPDWGIYTNVNTPVYDSDGDRSTYGATELTFIENVWKVVAEDFAPFNIDVTTEEPLVLAAGVPDDEANGVALRVAIGGSNAEWHTGTAGGVGYVDSFTDRIANTAYAFTEYEWGVSTNHMFVGGTVSHEAGHALGLEHQSQYDANGTRVEEYLPAIGNWSAIMGRHGDLDHATWHYGQNSKGSTVDQDDIAMIGRAANRFGFRADDHADTFATATLLSRVGANWTATGLVGTTTDFDVFSFTTATTHELRIVVDGNAPGQNLDAVLRLYDAQGALLASSNPSDSLDAFLQRNLVSGTYFIAVTSDGRYGRIGQYSLRVSPIASVSIADVSIEEGKMDNGMPLSSPLCRIPSTKL